MQRLLVLLLLGLERRVHARLSVERSGPSSMFEPCTSYGPPKLLQPLSPDTCPCSNLAVSVNALATDWTAWPV